jgi:hypothetical protein
LAAWLLREAGSGTREVINQLLTPHLEYLAQSQRDTKQTHHIKLSGPAERESSAGR